MPAILAAKKESTAGSSSQDAALPSSSSSDAAMPLRRLQAGTVCDPEAPIQTTQQFRAQPIPTVPTSGDPMQDNDLCDGRWQWYRLDPKSTQHVPRTVREVGVDGVTRTVTEHDAVERTMSVAIMFDAVWMRQANRFPTSDVMVVNGIENMPTNWDVPALFNVEGAVAASAPGMVHWHTGVDSLTLTVGYNTTLDSQKGCAAPMNTLIMVGVRCGWGQPTLPCVYNVSARLLPRLIYDGDEVDAPIAAGDLHYFALDIGEFDVVTLTLLRLNHDLTYSVLNSETSVMETRFHDYALRGELIAQRGYCPDPTMLPPPPPPPGPPPSPPPPKEGDESDGTGGSSSTDAGAGGSSSADVADPTLAAAISYPWSHIVTTPITNATAEATLEFFCTTAVEAGFYAVAVAADLIQGPINLPHEQTRVGGASCQDGYVGPNGYPIYTSPSALGALPQCNPSGASNELRPNRPYYRLSVHHKMYTDEPLSRNELRPACISYNQMRRYTVVTDGEGAANLYIALSTRVSRVFISENRPPNLIDYDVASADEAMLALADRSSAMPDAPGSTDQTTVSASPCNAGAQRTWHVAIYLADQLTAAKNALTQVAFNLSSTLSSARKQEDETILPRMLGGTGSTCCGGMTHFVIRLNTSLRALRARVNVTAGALRAVYIKHGSCAVFPTDISGQQCTAQGPLCHMTWYERYDRYTGVKLYMAANQTLVPSGGTSPDKRAVGDWVISLQDAGVAVRTEFTLQIDTQAAVATDDAEGACDRYGRYDCSNSMWKVPTDLAELHASAAPPRAAAANLASVGSPMVALALLAAAWLGRR